MDGVIVVSSNWIPGHSVKETRGFVYGLTVRSRGLGRNITAGLRSIAGGEIHEYVEMMQQSRDEALYRMVEHAKAVGANGVISTYFDSSEISDYMQEILAYGTAVIIETQ
ncbi:MAG: heavy metal-binding domain-containing protein [Halobacteriota archaeon]